MSRNLKNLECLFLIRRRNHKFKILDPQITYSGGKNKSEKPDFPNEMAFFKWSWQRVKVLPRPWASKSKLSMIRPLKWGTLCLWTPTGFKMASRQSLKIKENVRLTSKTDVFFFLPTLTAGHFETSWSS